MTPSKENTRQGRATLMILTVLLLALGLISGCQEKVFAEIDTDKWADAIDMDKIAMIESSGNPLAWNKKGDSRGLYQITPICLKEWNNYHATKHYTMQDLWDVRINTEIAEWYMNKRIPQMIKHYGKEDTIENRLIAYNAGIRYVKTGAPIPKITSDYLRKYK